MTEKFHKRDRVELSDEGKRVIFTNTPHDVRGTVVGVNTVRPLIKIKLDHRKSTGEYHESFWQLCSDQPPTLPLREALTNLVRAVERGSASEKELRDAKASLERFPK